jgi:hypothetical protein
MWTLFAGGVLTHEREWSDATDRFIDAARPYINTVQLVEIKNESNGPPIELARQLAARVRVMLGCPVAITGTPENELGTIYRDSRATFLTFHPDRKEGERGYRTIRQIKHELSNVPDCWGNTEPIGIDSSVSRESDPVRLAAGAITTWMCGAGLHVVHHGAGIRAGGVADRNLGRAADSWDQSTLEPTLVMIAAAKARLPVNLCNWSRKTHGWNDHPLKFSTLVGDAVESRTMEPGCNRAYAMVAADGRWHCFIAGIQGHVAFTVAGPMAVWSLGTGRIEHVPAGRYELSAADWSDCALVSSE